MRAKSNLATLLDGLADVERRGATDADSTSILAHMQAAASEPGGLRRLVEHFAGSLTPVLARTVAFLLARGASTAPDPGSVAPLVWTAIGALAIDDEWTRVNLLSATQLLGARDALPGQAEPVPQGLPEFLVDSLRRGSAVLDAAGPALLTLDAHGVLKRLAPDDRRRLKDALLQLPVPSDAFTRNDLDALKARLAGQH